MSRCLYLSGIILINLFLISGQLLAQSPGGIGSNLGLWLKANSGPENASALPASNGEAITFWRDRSGLANDYTAVAGPTMVDNVLNFNPAVEILSGGFDAPAASALSTNWTIFFVSRKLASDQDGRVFDGHAGNFLWAHWGTYRNGLYLNGNPSEYNSGIATTSGIQNLHLHSYKRESVGGTLEARTDGASLKTFGTSNSATGTRIDINQGAFSAETSDSRVGEMIIYNSALTAAEVNQVESYLALKYGLTIAHDYLASDGSTIWDYTANAGYNTNLTGIGRDDNSTLDQRKSLSVNAGSDVTIDKGGAFGTDLDFIVFGDNNAVNGTSDDKPVAYGKRLNKAWLAQISGTPGAVSLSIDLTDLGLPIGLTATDYELLIDGDGVFNDAATTVAGTSISGGVLTFGAVTLSDGDHFTIAVLSSALKGPANVTENLKLWLKADAGVAGATPITSWTDQAGNGYVATAPGTAPTLLSNQLNFNPIVDFTNSHLRIPGGIMGSSSSTYTSSWVYAVMKGDVIQNNTLLYESLAGTETFNVLVPWSNSNIYLDFGNTGGTGRINVASGATVNAYNMWTTSATTLGTSPSGTNKALARDGLLLTTLAGADATVAGNNQPFFIGGGYNTGLTADGTQNQLDGKVAELIVYTGVPTELEQEKIQSYLSIKYGITKNSADAADVAVDGRNYFASDGSITWDYTANATYHNNVAGIGRDDASELDQQQSRSINTGADVTINKGGAFGTDLSFILWGDNNAANGTSTDTPGGYSKRLSKVWRTDVTGTPGSVSFSIDLTDLGLPIGLAPTDYALLIDGDGTFNAGAAIHMNGAAIGAAQLSFTNVTFNDGDYFTIAVSSSALKGPANITNNLKLWLKADAGVAGATPITSWTDQAGNGYTATAPGNAPDLLNNQINFNPAIDFTSASAEHLRITGGIMGSSTYNNLWAYTVLQGDIAQNNTLMFEALSSGWITALLPWSGQVYYDYGNAGRINGAWGGTYGAYNMWTLGTSTSTSTPNGTRKAISRDGSVIHSNDINDDGTGNNQPFYIGGGYNTGVGTVNPFDGKIAEMIIYTGVPSELEQEKIQSYLGVKYGITKNSADIAGTVVQDERNYFASDGTIIWDYATNTTYHNNVAGVGRDDASELDQQQSRSINTGADVTINKGGAFGTDLSFILWGDNNAANGTSTDTPGGYSKRLSKVWRTDVTGTPGSVSFSIDLTDLGLPIGLAPTDYALLIDGDGTFNAGAAIHTNGAALGAAQLSFTNVNFADGDYFTIAVLSSALKGPANVTNNLKLWLKANAGIAGATPITSWTDQAGNGYTATAPGNAPDLLNSQLNFNPVLDFTSASSEYLQIANGIMGSSTYNDVWAYTVHKADAIQTNTIFYENMAAGERVSVLLPWSDSNIYFDYANGGGGRLSGAWGGSINSYNMWTLGSSTSTSTPTGLRKAISRDGLVILSNNNNDGGTGNNQPFLIGGGYATGLGTSNPFDGKLAEMIVYTGVPSELEQEKIQSYLGVKYGITKNSADIAGTAGQDERNYFASDGSIIWDYAANTAYHNRVTGIGRDDASELDQQQSLSISAGAILTLNKAMAFGSDLSFIVAGDDGGSLSSTNLSLAPYTKRTTRIWRADVTGAPGTINVSFNISSGVHNSGNVSDYALLIKHADTDFTTSDIVHTTGASLVNNVLTFTGVPFIDGDYFTLGIIVFSPGGLQTPAFWVKAGAGVTGTTDVSIWADQSGGGNNATQVTFANQPSLVASDINFNPSIDFSGTTDVFQLTNAPANLNSTIFAVGTPMTNTTYRTMFRGAVNDHPIIINSGATTLGYWDNDDVGFKSGGFTWAQSESALVGLEMYAGNVNFRKNGSQGASIATINLAGLNLNYFGNYQLGNQRFGKIAEAIVYNNATPLTTTEKETIESYLAVKYGVTLAHNYLATNSSIIWNTTTNAAYGNRITGIGRDDLTTLDQRKSKSVATGSILTIEKTTPASAFGTDLSYLVAGDDAGILGATTTNVHPGYPMRVTRIWKTTVTGTPGTVSVSFDLGSGIYNTGNAGDYALLIKSANTDFTTGATAHVAGASLLGNVLIFTGVALATDDYFSLGLPRIASPGGIVNNLRMWMKADAGVTGGANASAWADQTGYYFTANQGTPANQPAVIANRLNFNPAIQFDGTNDQMIITGGTLGTSTYTDLNVFAVSRANVIQNNSMFVENVAAGGRITALAPWSDNNIYWDAGSGAAPHRLNAAWGGSVNTGYLWSLLSSTTATAAGGLNLQNIFRNGTSVASDGTMASFTGNGSNFTVGSFGGSFYFNGEISELITYTGPLSAAQYQRIQSYLAIKYGITLDQSVATNYVASNGSVIWDGTANATYKVNIAGIGRDDASALSQPKSASVNANSIVTIDKGSSFGTDLDFLIWGSDNAYNSPTTANKHPSYAYRLGKTWRVDVNGTPGTVSVSFDLSTGIYNTGNVADYALLIHSTSDFNSGTAHTTGAVFNGSTLTFTNVNFTDGDYFTLGMPTPPAPGGIVNNMGIWLKANQGVTGGANASAWSDQSGNNLNVTQGTAGNQPAVVANGTNFNPSIQFDGTNDNLSLTGGILGTNSFTDVYAFVVSKTNVITASYPFYETNSGGQFSLRAPWSDNTLYWEPGNTGVNRVSAAWGGTTGTSFLWGLTASTTATPSGQRQDIFRNGFNLGSDATMGAFTGNNSNFFVGSGSGASYYNGEVSEMVIYRGALTGTMMQQIQSYMALKYGITLVGQNYLSSTGSSIYNTTTTHASYVRDIAGIGRDDNSALSQLKSQSINSPVDLISVANSDFTTPAAFTNSGEFLVWGHNGQPNLADPNAASFTHAGTLIVRQLSRIWSTQKTGTPSGNAIVEVDMNLVIGPSGFGTNDKTDIRLLLDNDAIFGNSSGGEFTYSTGVVNGEKMYFTVPYANISAGQGFFTVASVNATTAPITTPTPGGVIGDMRLWLKANAGVSGATPISAWADQSVNAFNATVPGNGPDFIANQFNNNPAIDFTRASNEYVRIASGIMGSTTYNDAWIYVVSQADLIADQTIFFESMTGGKYMSSLIPWSNANIYFDFGNGGGAGRINGAWGGSVSTHNIWTLGSSTGTLTPSGTRKSIARDGGIILTNNNNDNATGANQPFVIGGGYNTGVGTANNFDGRIAELIVFGEVPTELEQEKIQSYLAIKYGISKNTTDIAGTVGQDERDYFASDGTVVWDYSVNAPFNNKIAGVGRDDISALDQRKSQSNTTLSIVSMDKAGAFGSNKDFLLWGHDNGLLGLTTTGANASLTYRLGRVWKADLTGTPGAVTVGFDLSSGIYNSGNAADYRLLYGSSSSDFSAATVVVGTFVGNVITFTGIPFTDNDFFTLGVANMPAPGGVVPNMQYWVKADLGVTGAANASAWADQSGNAFNVTQVTAASQPTVMSNRTNFNSAILFDGTNDQMTLTGGILGTANYTDYNVFIAARTNTVTASSTFFETVTGGRINAHMPWSDNILYWDAGANSATQRLQVAWGGSVATNYIWGLTASTTATASGARQEIYRNGRRLAFDNNMTAFTGNGSVFNLGSAGGGSYFNGDIDEVVMYRGNLTASQLQKIQSYLAIKWGISLDQTVATSYYASDWNGATGTVVWDATAAGIYKTDITVIGRDDNSALNQKQSGSINPGSVLAIGNTTIAADNASNANNFSVDKSFFSMAHNNAPVTGFGITDMGTTVNAENIVARIARTSLAQETGTVGTLKVRFSLGAVLGVGGVPGANDLGNVRLLVDADGVFATGATSISPTAYDNSTDIVEFDHDFVAGTGFYFSVGSVDLSVAPLPVDLISFTANARVDGVDIKWITSSELNNDYFEVESSPDTKTWSTVAVVTGQGTKQSETKYEITDHTPLMGVSYYRLKQVDLDGKFKYSSLVKVDYQGNGIKIFPNPSNGKDVVIEINSKSAENLMVEVSSMQGQSLYKIQVDNTEPRRQKLTVDLTALSQGFYLVTLKSSDKIQTSKLIIEK